MPQIVIRQQPTELIAEFFARITYSQVVVLADENTAQFCYPLIQAAIPEHQRITIKAGEEQKTLETCQQVWEQLTNLKLDRHSLIIILGGGVLGDMGGFCAATYKRGIDFVLMPTTLLAQADASVGGKLGIDFMGYKNHIGVFCEPQATLISPAFLKTLPERELRSGFAEVIKHCIISDKVTWDTLRKKNVADQDWETLLAHSVDFKRGVVATDPKEKGLRKILNFGHTIGHAVESYYLQSGNRIFHGEAIAIGMVAEAAIATSKNLLKNSERDEITAYLKITYPHITIPANRKIIFDFMLQDKKNKGNKILMALPEGIGKARWDVEVTREEINSALDFYQSVYT
ncbi:MAG: 3-dehydroquinate synthase [Cyclobacteriaceae bacterium]|nr:3-dehydroquinate synthase [Cyclobacteriaceae bacterium]